MCTVSMVADHYRDMFVPKPWFPKPGVPWHVSPPSAVSREEFDELKRQVSEMAELLKRAKIYDERNNEPDCEIEEKMELLRKVARLVGVDLDRAINAAPEAQ